MQTSFCEIDNRRVIRLNELSKKVGWSHQSILNILKKAGYVLPNNSPKLFLNRKHIDVLAFAYIKVIKAKHESLNSKSSYIVRNMHDFFRQFINKDQFENELESIKLKEISAKDAAKSRIEILVFSIQSVLWPNEPDVLSFKLDDGLIYEYFIRLVDSNNEFVKQPKHIFTRINFYVNQFFIDIRTRIFHLILSKDYHIFASEDEHNGVAISIQKDGFSQFQTQLREALVNSKIYFKQLITWTLLKNKLLLSI